MSTEVILSSVKREKLLREKKVRAVQELRAALKPLTRDEIRRHRLPHHEAMLIELREQGFASSAEYIQQLIQCQEEMRKKYGYESVIGRRPLLVNDTMQLDILSAGLKKAETAHCAAEVDKECDELMRLGIHFAFGSEDWWWLGEQLLIQTVATSDSFQKDGGRREALSRYIYGKFLFENLADYHDAKRELTLARQTSAGKVWSARAELGIKQDTIFIESCKLLHKALLAEAAHVISTSPPTAAGICEVSRKRAVDACDRKGEANALMLKGMCELAVGDASAAIVSFTKVLALYGSMEYAEGICEARIHLALTHQKVGNVKETLVQLQALLDYSKDHILAYYEGQSYRFLGEYYLKMGTPSVATPLLLTALHMFENVESQEQVRNLAAISAGQELMEKYTQLILKCGKTGSVGRENVFKLMNWKDNRELFWKKKENSQVSDSTSVSSFEVTQSSLISSKLLDESIEDILDEE